MTFRGVYRDGVVYLKDASGLPDGTVVRVTRASNGRSVAGKARKQATGGARSRSVKAKNSGRPLPGFGAWKNRADIRDTAGFARAVRRRVSARGA
jgi:hypothetical protein